MTLLQTNRLLIRNVRARDWEALHALICHYEASEFAAYDQPWPTSPEEIKSITEWFGCVRARLAADQSRLHDWLFQPGGTGVLQWLRNSLAETSQRHNPLSLRPAPPRGRA